jgi:hypothetical protein
MPAVIQLTGTGNSMRLRAIIHGCWRWPLGRLTLEGIVQGILRLIGASPRYMVSRALQARRHFPQTLHDEGGMGLPWRHKVLLHADANLERPSLEPTSAA